MLYIHITCRLTKILKRLVEEGGGDMTAEQQVEAAVFQKAFIPKTLGEVDEKNFIKDSASGVENTYYGTVTGACVCVFVCVREGV